MPLILINDAYLTQIGDAIREKDGSTTTYKPSEMADAIRGWYSTTDNLVMGTMSGVYYNDRITEIGDWAFAYQHDLTEIELPNLDKVGSYAFYGITNLESIKCDKLDIINGFFVSGANMTKLQTVKLPSAIRLSSQAFKTCKASTIVLPQLLHLNGGQIFYDATNLTTLVFGSDTMVDGWAGTYSATTISSEFTNTPIANGTGYIYVPAALVDSYKAHTGWSVLANQFRAIEDYPEIQALIE